MKIHLKFNHKSDDVLKALDCPLSPEEINENLNEILRTYAKNESMTTSSQLAELIHNNIDYSVILYFATLKVKDVVIQQGIEKLFEDDYL